MAQHLRRSDHRLPFRMLVRGKEREKVIGSALSFFLRALEGGYISLSGDKQVSLVRKEFTKDSNENEHRMFEFSVCNRCGDIALVGAIETDEDTGKQYLKSNNPLSPLDGHRAWQYFHIVREGTDDADKNKGNVDNDDQENGDENSEQEDYWLCPECGQIAKGAKPLCQHNPGSFVHLRTQKNGNDKDKCLFASREIIKDSTWARKDRPLFLQPHCSKNFQQRKD